MIEKIKAYFKSVAELDSENAIIKTNKKKVDKKLLDLTEEKNSLQKELLEIYRDKNKKYEITEHYFEEYKKFAEKFKKLKVTLADTEETCRYQCATIDELTTKIDKLEKQNKRLKADKKNGKTN